MLLKNHILNLLKNFILTWTLLAMISLLKFNKPIVSSQIKNLKNIMIRTILSINILGNLPNLIQTMKIQGTNSFIVKWKASITMISIKNRKRLKDIRKKINMMKIISKQNKERSSRRKSNWQGKSYLLEIQYGKERMHLWIIKKGKEGLKKNKNNLKSYFLRALKLQVQLKNGSSDHKIYYLL